MRSRLLIPIMLVFAFLIQACERGESPPPPATAEPPPEPAAPAESEVQAIVPQPIPPGFDFPADRAVLQAEVDANDIAAMTDHAWNIWGGLTADSNSSYNGQTLPIWETWLANEQVFTDPPMENKPLPTLERPGREFTDPAQFFHETAADADSAGADDSLVVGFNKFDPSMTTYLWTGHPAPDAPGSTFFYTSTQSLDALNTTWPAGTEPIDRTVVDAPKPALELKPVLLWVAQSGLTAIPFWQGPNASTAPHCQDVDVNMLRNPQPGQPPTRCHPDPTTWTHCVLIDPAASTDALRAATADEFAQANKQLSPSCTDAANAQYGGLNMIYHFKMDAQEASDFNAEQNPPVKASAGDFGVLMAMHVNTKELKKWTWQTFWWQGGQDAPEAYPGSSAGIIPKVVGLWRNYNSCNAYSQTAEPGNQGSMRVCFNPYLETSPGIPDGLSSNCVTCHGTARVPSPKVSVYPPSYDGPVDFNDPSFYDGSTVTRTDFSWAIPQESN